MSHPLDVATLKRLRRLDRRLRVEPCPKLLGFYDIVYDDADGIRCVALKKVKSLNGNVFRRLLMCMPWRFNQRFSQFIRRGVDQANERKHQADVRRTVRAASERAWDDYQFIRRRGGGIDMAKAFERDAREEDARMQERR